jgi:hypothetical protein
MFLYRFVRDRRIDRPKSRQRAEVPENATEKRRVRPMGDVAEIGKFDVGCDSFWFTVRGHVPAPHFGFSVEHDAL